MSEDLNLIILAGKAFGLEITRFGQDFNPSDDDGDAFRLAAHLRIGIEYDGDYVIVAGLGQELPVVGQEEIEGIVRRLIVEAAAEIGRSMP